MHSKLFDIEIGFSKFFYFVNFLIYKREKHNFFILKFIYCLIKFYHFNKKNLHIHFHFKFTQ